MQKKHASVNSPWTTPLKSLVGGFVKVSRWGGRHHRVRGLFIFAVLFAIFWLIGWQRLDPDFGWHLQAGNYFRAHGIPAHDIYTYTARSYRWIDHEWGNDVILSLVYSLGGYALATTLYALLWSGALMIAAARARLLILVAAAAAITPYAGIRPIAWTAFFFAVMLTAMRNPRSRWLWGLPLLFVVWANLHAGFCAGLAVIAYFAIRRRQKSLALLFVVCVLATFVNAYGLRLYGEIFRTLTDPSLHTQVREWAYFSIPDTAWLFVLLWATGFWAFDRSDWKHWLGLSPLLLIASLSATRNLPLFVVAAACELDEHVSHVQQSIPKNLDRPRRVVLAALSGSIIIFLLFTVHISVWPKSSNREAYYPVQAVAYLQAHPCSGNLFNSYDYGGYLIWKLPSQPVYIDGRMPTWQPYMNNYEAIIHQPATHYAKQFQQYHISCALIQEDSMEVKLINVLEQAKWRIVVQANGSLLLLAPNPSQ